MLGTLFFDESDVSTSLCVSSEVAPDERAVPPASPSEAPLFYYPSFASSGTVPIPGLGASLLWWLESGGATSGGSGSGGGGGPQAALHLLALNDGESAAAAQACQARLVTVRLPVRHQQHLLACGVSQLPRGDHCLVVSWLTVTLAGGFQRLTVRRSRDPDGPLEVLPEGLVVTLGAPRRLRDTLCGELRGTDLARAAEAMVAAAHRGQFGYENSNADHHHTSSNTSASHLSLALSLTSSALSLRGGGDDNDEASAAAATTVATYAMAGLVTAAVVSRVPITFSEEVAALWIVAGARSVHQVIVCTDGSTSTEPMADPGRLREEAALYCEAHMDADGTPTEAYRQQQQQQQQPAGLTSAPPSTAESGSSSSGGGWLSRLWGGSGGKELMVHGRPCRLQVPRRRYLCVAAVLGSPLFSLVRWNGTVDVYDSETMEPCPYLPACRLPTSEIHRSHGLLHSVGFPGDAAETERAEPPLHSELRSLRVQQWAALTTTAENVSTVHLLTSLGSQEGRRCVRSALPALPPSPLYRLAGRCSVALAAPAATCAPVGCAVAGHGSGGAPVSRCVVLWDTGVEEVSHLREPRTLTALLEAAASSSSSSSAASLSIHRRCLAQVVDVRVDSVGAEVQPVAAHAYVCYGARLEAVLAVPGGSSFVVLEARGLVSRRQRAHALRPAADMLEALTDAAVVGAQTGGAAIDRALADDAERDPLGEVGSVLCFAPCDAGTPDDVDAAVAWLAWSDAAARRAQGRDDARDDNVDGSDADAAEDFDAATNDLARASRSSPAVKALLPCLEGLQVLRSCPDGAARFASLLRDVLAAAGPHMYELPAFADLVHTAQQAFYCPSYIDGNADNDMDDEGATHRRERDVPAVELAVRAALTSSNAAFAAATKVAGALHPLHYAVPAAPDFEGFPAGLPYYGGGSFSDGMAHSAAASGFADSDGSRRASLDFCGYSRHYVCQEVCTALLRRILFLALSFVGWGCSSNPLDVSAHGSVHLALQYLTAAYQIARVAGSNLVGLAAAAVAAGSADRYDIDNNRGGGHANPVVRAVLSVFLDDVLREDGGLGAEEGFLGGADDEENDDGEALAADLKTRLHYAAVRVADLLHGCAAPDTRRAAVLWSVLLSPTYPVLHHYQLLAHLENGRSANSTLLGDLCAHVVESLAQLPTAAALDLLLHKRLLLVSDIPAALFSSVTVGEIIRTAEEVPAGASLLYAAGVLRQLAPCGSARLAVSVPLAENFFLPRLLLLQSYTEPWNDTHPSGGENEEADDGGFVSSSLQRQSPPAPLQQPQQQQYHRLHLLPVALNVLYADVCFGLSRAKLGDLDFSGCLHYLLEGHRAAAGLAHVRDVHLQPIIVRLIYHVCRSQAALDRFLAVNFDCPAVESLLVFKWASYVANMPTGSASHRDELRRLRGATGLYTFLMRRHAYAQCGRIMSTLATRVRCAPRRQHTGPDVYLAVSEMAAMALHAVEMISPSSPAGAPSDEEIGGSAGGGSDALAATLGRSLLGQSSALGSSVFAGSAVVSPTTTPAGNTGVSFGALAAATASVSDPRLLLSRNDLPWLRRHVYQARCERLLYNRGRTVDCAPLWQRESGAGASPEADDDYATAVERLLRALMAERLWVPAYTFAGLAETDATLVLEMWALDLVRRGPWEAQQREWEELTGYCARDSSLANGFAGFSRVVERALTQSYTHTHPSLLHAHEAADPYTAVATLVRVVEHLRHLGQLYQQQRASSGDGGDSNEEDGGAAGSVGRHSEERGAAGGGEGPDSDADTNLFHSTTVSGSQTANSGENPLRLTLGSLSGKSAATAAPVAATIPAAAPSEEEVNRNAWHVWLDAAAAATRVMRARRLAHVTAGVFDPLARHGLDFRSGAAVGGGGVGSHGQASFSQGQQPSQLSPRAAAAAKEVFSERHDAGQIVSDFYAALDGVYRV